MMAKLFVGGVGAGKSRACMEEQAEVCMKTPGGLSIALRASLTRSETSLVDEYKKVIPGMAKWMEAKGRFEFYNGHVLQIVPADVYDRFGSNEYVTIFMQEAQEIKFSVFDFMSTRLRNPAGMIDGQIPMYRILLDARAPKRSHWLYDKFVKDGWYAESPEEERAKVKNPNFVWIKGMTGDNTANLPPGYEDTQRQLHAGEIAWIKMMIEGEFGFDVEGRPVYECYDPDIHDSEIIEDKGLPILRGWDFGYNLPAVVWAQYTREGRFNVLHEFCPQGMARHDLVREVESLQRGWFENRHSSGYQDFGDAAGTSENTTGQGDIDFIEEKLQTTIETRRARIADGLNVIRRLMTTTKKLNGKQKPLFQIDLSCEKLREALGGAYYYDKDKNDEKPVKGNGYDDVADALRYVAQCVVEERNDDHAGYRDHGISTFATYTN